ncbi:transposase, IS116/IS110/IS902 family [Leptospira interrogans serovar Pyrogenes str. 200701872]|uniref:Transposase, IS116/IS110/IS902 family n=1 Tax=Leptospira interrogans serovar Pyrogenes str. 200701872 TaxID=1193029 RepID=M7AFE7_LEPIR|nr:transposase, IS116/IS110/IS902 family [Leptospira interrogans serovar Pyrogenes str. 200701872]
MTLLSDRYKREAERILKVLDLVELNLKLIEEEIQEALKKNKDLCSDDHVYAWNWNDYFFGDQSKLNISLPTGSVRISLTWVDCKRILICKQAAYYAGLVPRVDISGDTVRYGRIINRGCHSIRRVIVQAAWSLVRCQHGGKVKEFYQRLYLKKGS